MNILIDKHYSSLLQEIKQKYQSAQLKAAYAVHEELIKFYWYLGKEIIERQTAHQWGSKFLEQLSNDLQKLFPGTKGFSVRNLKFMRQFAEIYPEMAIGKQSVSQLPWGHIILLMQRVKEPVARDWYLQNSLKNNISRNILSMQIEQQLYERQGREAKKVSNFSGQLPKPQSDLAIDMLKNPYNFDFLTIGNEAKEREIEDALVKHISKFLVELGSGFAFMGNQYKITVGHDDYFLDMLFYHVKLRSYVVIELKAGKFKPEYSGKLNFYLAAVDEALKSDFDNPTIGLLLCKEREQIKAEYSLRGVTTPIGISEYHLIRDLPKQLEESLPTIDQLETELALDNE